MANPTQNAVVAYVQSKLGQPYLYGGPPTGGPTDCSGLADEAYASVGIGIPRTSQAQWAWCKQYGYTTIYPQPGDLVFTEGNPPGHVGIYIGGGNVIQDPYTGAVVDIIGIAVFGAITGIGEPWRAGAATANSPSSGVAAVGCLPTMLMPWRLFR